MSGGIESLCCERPRISAEAKRTLQSGSSRPARAAAIAVTRCGPSRSVLATRSSASSASRRTVLSSSRSATFTRSPFSEPPRLPSARAAAARTSGTGSASRCAICGAASRTMRSASTLAASARLLAPSIGLRSTSTDSTSHASVVGSVHPTSASRARRRSNHGCSFFQFLRSTSGSEAGRNTAACTSRNAESVLPLVATRFSRSVSWSSDSGL